MILFEIHQRFKGHFLKELRVSFKDVSKDFFTFSTDVSSSEVISDFDILNFFNAQVAFFSLTFDW